MDPTSKPGLFVLVVLLAPALLAGLVLLGGDLVRRGQPLGWIGALGAGLAYLGGHFFALPAPPVFPPPSSDAAVYWTGAIALAAGIALGARARAAWASTAMVAIAATGAAAFVLRNFLGRMETPEVALVVGILLLASAASFAGVERTARAARGFVTPLVLWIATSSAAACQALTGSAKFAIYAALLSAVLGAAITVGFLRKQLDLARGFAAVIVVQHVALLAAGAYSGDLPKHAALLLALAPAASALVSEARATALGPRKTLLARAGLVAVVAGAALASSAYAYFANKSSSPYGY
ncbi:MAG: hypothetical protein JNN27_19045 [Planctomycetes bacterium]|nr:hypothetical protein [Planctomycetota bacterium]